jgi:hypothetical protein
MALRFALLVLPLAAAASAQTLPTYTDLRLRTRLLQASPVVRACAAELDADVELVSVDVRVTGRRGVSTLQEARIELRLDSEPRDRGLEGCLRRRLRRHVRTHGRFDVPPGTVAARSTFRLPPRRRPPPPPPPPPYRASQVRRVLDGVRHRLLRCGAAPPATLHVAVDPDGTLRLATVEGAPVSTWACLGGVVAHQRIPARPRGGPRVTYRL